MTGPHGWRFGSGYPFRIGPAHRPVWNPPRRPHANKAGAVPFPCLFGWTRDANEPVALIPAGDWGEKRPSLLPEGSVAMGGIHYPPRLIAMLEALWGEGFLSPGGAEEVARIIAGHDLTGLAVLDIGCGAGGIDIALVRDHGAGYVTGIDVEDPVLDRARALVARAGLAGRIGLARVAPGPLPFPPRSFDVVFSKDSIVHIPDKHALMAEVFRVLKPGGWFLASDWLIGTDAVSPQMADYIAAEGLDFGMATPARYREAMAAAGFDLGTTISRNAWYRIRAREELERLRGDVGAAAARAVGQDFVAHNIAIWARMVPVLDTGEHCPTHLAARRPGPPVSGAGT